MVFVASASGLRKAMCHLRARLVLCLFFIFSLCPCFGRVSLRFVYVFVAVELFLWHRAWILSFCSFLHWQGRASYLLVAATASVLS